MYIFNNTISMNYTILYHEIIFCYTRRCMNSLLSIYYFYEIMNNFAMYKISGYLGKIEEKMVFII